LLPPPELTVLIPQIAQSLLDSSNMNFFHKPCLWLQEPLEDFISAAKLEMYSWLRLDLHNSSGNIEENLLCTHKLDMWRLGFSLT